MMAVIDKEMKVIDEFDVSEGYKLKLQVGKYKGVEKIDLRLWVDNAGNSEYAPTKRGINFNIEWLDRFIKMVDKLKNI
ncbi:hypothetical protein ES705_23838 [subsurface metagenome]